MYEIKGIVNMVTPVKQDQRDRLRRPSLQNVGMNILSGPTPANNRSKATDLAMSPPPPKLDVQPT